MDEVEYRKTFELEDSHWWFRGKRALVEGLVARFGAGARPTRSLDVGCGTGATMRLLSGWGEAHGVDRHPLALALARRRGLRTLARADATALPYGARRFDLVAMLDVLYHRDVGDVDRALAEAARVSRPGALLIVTDSAFAFLKGPHDVAYHAARRFRRYEVARAMERCGFEILKCSYANATLFPVAVAVRFAQRLRFGETRAQSSLARPSPAVNAVLAVLYALEGRLLRHVSLPFGLSVLVVGRRIGDPNVAAVRTDARPGVRGRKSANALV